MSAYTVWLEKYGCNSLPLYYLKGNLVGPMPAFGSGTVKPNITDYQYTSPQYGLRLPSAVAIARDAQKAKQAVDDLLTHQGDFGFFVQFEDASQDQKRCLHDHTELVVTMCDTRLSLDAGFLWSVFDKLFSFESINSQFRSDPDREEKRQEFVDRLKRTGEQRSDSMIAVARFKQRAITQIEINASKWSSMTSFVSDTPTDPSSEVKLFYSYSHKDESFRDDLETHLSMLRRQGFIREWHDRRISSGTEWKGKIDENLESAHIVLLLISSDFLASDYCYDVEMKRALERHEEGTTRVIPVFLRSCMWSDAPFAELQGLPRDAKPITAWDDRDEAFTSVAEGIRDVVKETRT